MGSTSELARAALRRAARAGAALLPLPHPALPLRRDGHLDELRRALSPRDEADPRADARHPPLAEHHRARRLGIGTVTGEYGGSGASGNLAIVGVSDRSDSRLPLREDARVRPRARRAHRREPRSGETDALLIEIRDAAQRDDQRAQAPTASPATFPRRSPEWTSCSSCSKPLFLPLLQSSTSRAHPPGGSSLVRSLKPVGPVARVQVPPDAAALPAAVHLHRHPAVIPLIQEVARLGAGLRGESPASKPGSPSRSSPRGSTSSCAPPPGGWIARCAWCRARGPPRW